MGWEGDSLGTVQEIEIWPYEQVVSAQSGIRAGERDAQNFLVFWYTNGSPYLCRTTRNSISQQKIENLPNCGHCRSGWLQGKAERKRKERILQGYLKTVEHDRDGDTNCNWGSRYSHQRIGKGTGWTENKNTREDHPNDRSARILRRVLETWGDLLSLRLQ